MERWGEWRNMGRLHLLVQEIEFPSRREEHCLQNPVRMNATFRYKIVYVRESMTYILIGIHLQSNHRIFRLCGVPFSSLAQAITVIEKPTDTYKLPRLALEHIQRRSRPRSSQSGVRMCNLRFLQVSPVDAERNFHAD